MIIHDTSTPMFATENFASPVVAHEWGYAKWMGNGPDLPELPLEWSLVNARPRGVISYNLVGDQASAHLLWNRSWPTPALAGRSRGRGIVSTNVSEHYFDFEALGKIHAAPEIAIPALKQVISNSPRDRYYAVAAVGQFGSEAKPALPLLVALLHDPSIPSSSPRGTGFVSDRENIERALQKIDSERHAQLITNAAAALAP